MAERMQTSPPGNHSERIRALEDTAIEHRMRLENGTQVFADYDERLKQVEPKQLSPVKIVGLTLSIVGMAVGALMWLTDNFGARPTRHELHDFVESHDKRGHDATQKDIRDIQQQQIQQRVIIEQMQERQGEQNDKLDELLERIPDRRRR